MGNNFSNNIKVSYALNTKQKELFKYLFLEAKNIYRRDNSIRDFNIETKRIFKTLNIRYNIIELFEFEKNLEKLMNNKISYIINSTDKNEIIRGKFNLISSYNIRDNIFNYSFPDEMLESIDGKNYFSTLDFLVSIEFELRRSLTLYKELNKDIDKSKRKNIIEISLEKYRELMGVSEIYKRFYDLERKVINPILADINSYSQYFISLKKKKLSKNSKSKVEYLIFEIYLKKDYLEISNLLSEFPQEVRNNSALINKIEEFYFKEGYNHIKKIILSSKENKENFSLEEKFIRMIDEKYADENNEETNFILHEEIKDGIEKFSKFKNKLGMLLLQARFELPELLDILNGVTIEKEIKYQNKYYKIIAYFSESMNKKFIRLYKK